jgi:hypothetical protein
MVSLSSSELVSLINAVFPPWAGDKSLAILIDIPQSKAHDSGAWSSRRKIAQEWANHLHTQVNQLNLESVDLVGYNAVLSNNADLPETACFIENGLPATADKLSQAGISISMDELFSSTDLYIAMTEMSATAPLKVAAKKYGFRAATMPGFSADMIPALRIDYSLVNNRCQILKAKLDAATSAKVVFLVDKSTKYEMVFDLRHRPAHASSGRFPESGTAGNLPSGETYIVPYEGEMAESSQTGGILPVQFDDEIVLFQIVENKAIKVSSDGPKSQEQAEYLNREPAYGNMAELGFGVLGDFGLTPINQVLLDEKLGFHIAFGRSDHFGGIVGPAQFTAPDNVVHIDRIYIKDTQPRVKIKSIILQYENGTLELMKNGKYLIF